jgi:hypothetical protein
MLNYHAGADWPNDAAQPTCCGQAAHDRIEVAAPSRQIGAHGYGGHAEDASADAI